MSLRLRGVSHTLNPPRSTGLRDGQGNGVLPVARMSTPGTGHRACVSVIAALMCVLLTPAVALGWSASVSGATLTVTDTAASSGFVIDRDALGFIVIQAGGGFDGVLPAGCAVDVDGDGFVHC